MPWRIKTLDGVCGENGFRGTGIAQKHEVEAMGMITFAELERRTANAVDQGDLVAGMIPAVGVTLLCADACAGKTTLMAAVTACVGLGQLFAGRATTQGKVAWVYQDRGSAGLAIHVARAVRGAGGSSLPMWVWNREDGPWTADDDEKVDELLAFLDEHDIRLLVIDNLRRVTSADESRSADMSAVFDMFHKLAAGRRAVVVLHHSTKKGDVVRGSGDIRASADSIVFLTAHGVGGNEVRLRVENHYGATHKLQLGREIGDERLSYTSKAAPAENHAANALGERICEALRQRGKMNATALKNELHVGKARLNDALERLKASGRIREEAAGRKARVFSLVSTCPESALDGSSPTSSPSQVEDAHIGDTPPPAPCPRAGPGPSRSPKGGETDETGPVGTATGAETVQDRSGQVEGGPAEEGVEGCGVKTSARAEVQAEPPTAAEEEVFRALVPLLEGGAAILRRWREDPPTPPTCEVAVLVAACLGFDFADRPTLSIHDIQEAVESLPGVEERCDADLLWAVLYTVEERQAAGESGLANREASRHVS